jgi:hypothetical protein
VTLSPSKQGMSNTDKDQFQEQIVRALARFRRRAFGGPIALDLSINTTDKTPSHAHTIAKNLLDLLARPRPNVTTSRQGLLYFDDNQVHALSVSCRHGEQHPEIYITACLLRALREDLGLAAMVSR